LPAQESPPPATGEDRPAPAETGTDAAGAEAAAEAPAYGGPFWSRPKLTGDWGGVRDTWARHGFTIDFDVTYTFQGVVDGGLEDPLLDAFSQEDDTGHTVSGDLQLEFDTGKAGLWEGGAVEFRLEGRAGRSVLQRAGTVSAVNNDALFPNVVDRFDDEALAITELEFSQYVLEKVAIFGGLLNTSEGDENVLTGSVLTNQHFLNGAILYSLVEDATVPNTSLGGGLLFEPSERLSGSFSVFGSSETAGENPFEDWEGTTFSTEWTLGHKLLERPGAQTFGFLYGINASRTDIAADPRTVIGSVLLGQPVPTTNADTWSFYHNAHQFIHGDAEGGWGLFSRFGMSDGDPNLVHWNVAGGIGGIGLIPGRRLDHWGLGVFYLNMSEEDLLQGLGVDNELGGELYYNLAVTPWFRLALDAQVIDSALPGIDTTWVLGVRTQIIL
jgi:porin